MRTLISASTLTLLAGNTWAQSHDCGDPPVVTNGKFHCMDGRKTCNLVCEPNFGADDHHLKSVAKKIRCRSGVWGPVQDGTDMPSCTNVCGAADGFTIDHSSLECQSVGGVECTPGVDCVHGDECSIACRPGFELVPQPRRDNALQCICTGVKCEWKGSGTKLDPASRCLPQKTKRIIGGQDGNRGADGYAISIGYQGRNPKSGKKEWTHFCGGVLLTSQWGVTAAHCQQRRLRAIVGEYELNRREGSEVQCRIVKQIRHPAYDFRTQNDIMMIAMRCRNLAMGEFIYPARLPAPGVDPRPGQQCRICGWGNTQYPVYIPAKKLQCVTLPVIDTHTCNGPDHYIGSIHDKIMCIGNLLEGGQDSCQGDSGGPANCGGIVHGIVMGGLYCAKPNYPGVYTKTNRYIGWMKDTIQANSGRKRGRRTRSRGKR